MSHSDLTTTLVFPPSDSGYRGHGVGLGRDSSVGDQATAAVGRRRPTRSQEIPDRNSSSAERRRRGGRTTTTGRCGGGETGGETTTNTTKIYYERRSTEGRDGFAGRLDAGEEIVGQSAF